MMLDQLTLGVQLLEEANFESFFDGDNQEAVVSLKGLVASSSWNYIYLYGASEVGKSHLLQACYHYATSLNHSCFYLPLTEHHSPMMFENLDHYRLVCLDNVEVIAGTDVEEALFHFFNRCVASNTKLLITSSSVPHQAGFRLPDLISRLSSGIVYQIKPLTDKQKLAALQLKARLRGFALTEDVAQYILNHHPRSMGALLKVLDKLDKASLEAQHRLTIPFVKSVLSHYSND